MGIESELFEGIEEFILPDGTAIVEVIAPDGTILFSASSETTQTFSVPTGQGLTYTTPADITGEAGEPVSPTVSFTITATGNNRITSTGSFAVTGLPTGLTVSFGNPTSGVANSVTGTISGVYPEQSNTVNLVFSGITVVSHVSKSITYDSTNVPAGSNDGATTGAAWSVNISGGIFQGTSGNTRTWLVPSGVNSSVTATLSLGTAPADSSGNTYFSNQRTIMRSHYHGGTQDGTLSNSPSASGISGWTVSNGVAGGTFTGTLSSATTSTTLTFNSVGISGSVRTAFLIMTSGNIPFALGTYFWDSGDVGFGEQNVLGSAVTQSVSASIGNTPLWNTSGGVFVTGSGSSSNPPNNTQQGNPQGSLNGQSGTVSWSLSGFSISGIPVTYSG